MFASFLSIFNRAKNRSDNWGPKVEPVMPRVYHKYTSNEFKQRHYPDLFPAEHVYTEEELGEMTISKIKELAAEKGYTITKSLKAEIIEEFLEQQEAAVAAGNDPGNDPDPDPHVYTQEELEAMEMDELESLAIELGYSISESEKEDFITAFLEAQGA